MFLTPSLPDTAGDGGVAISGDAIGGNAWKRGYSYNPPSSKPKGGNAQSGYSGSVDGGNAINEGGYFIYNDAFASE